jgi:hypothetical protein
MEKTTVWPISGFKGLKLIPGSVMSQLPLDATGTVRVGAVYVLPLTSTANDTVLVPLVEYL